jgi:hypothetical protein
MVTNIEVERKCRTRQQNVVTDSETDKTFIIPPQSEVFSSILNIHIATVPVVSKVPRLFTFYTPENLTVLHNAHTYLELLKPSAVVVRL